MRGIHEVKELSTVPLSIYSYLFSFSLCVTAGLSMGGKCLLLPTALSTSLESQKHRGHAWMLHGHRS